MYSDSPVTRYKQRGNFYLLFREPFQLGFQTNIWHCFEANQGKVAPDGVGGVLTRTADRLVRLGTDIPDA